MKEKVLLAVMAAFGLVLVRCGSDPCTKADDHLSSCATMLPSMTSGSSSSSGSMLFMPMCDGASLCKAECVNQFSCTKINGQSPDFESCLNGCNGK